MSKPKTSSHKILGFKNEQPCTDVESQQQIRKEVPVSCKPRFLNQIMVRHRNRRRTQAKRKTNKIKFQQVPKIREIKNKQDQIAQNQIQTETQQFLQRKTTFVHGNKIQGTWKNGVLHGNVTIQYETNEYFQGKYVNGVRVSGLVKFKDGTQYKGGFLKDVFHGQGSLKDPTGRVITCKWEEGQPGLKAKIQYPSGDIYYGQICNLKKHGQGHLFFKNGSKYIGKFVNGQITGYGCYYQNDKKIAEGIWKNGILQIQQNIKQILIQTLGNQRRNQIKPQSNQEIKKLSIRI